MNSSMNPISDLVDLVEQHSDVAEAVDALTDRLSASARSREQLEKTFDVLRRAFRKHVESRCGTSPPIVCSFCKKTQEEVAAIVVASDAAICDECAKLTTDVIEERAKKTSHRSRVGAIVNLVRRVGKAPSPKR